MILNYSRAANALAVMTYSYEVDMSERFADNPKKQQMIREVYEAASKRFFQYATSDLSSLSKKLMHERIAQIFERDKKEIEKRMKRKRKSTKSA